MTKMLLFSIAVSLIVLWAISCGGGGYSASGPTAPSSSTGGSTTPPPQTQTSAGTTITIVSSSGSGAFNPNPVQVPAGGTIEWRNTTNASHVLVMNDGAAIGTIGAGASITTTLSGAGGGYHCTIHPSMVGTINGSGGQQPPAADNSGY